MPLFPLSIKVEILINGTFVDISTYVYQRDGIDIVGGSSDKTPHDKPQPAQCKVTLDNRDGRFSPYNVSGPYYPFLKRNVQMRVSINNATSSSGNTYSGYRYWGEIRDWPPTSDLSGNDIYVQATAFGPIRRLTSHGGKGSALARYYASLTGNYAPIAYWPCEEDPDTSEVQAGLSGGSNMTVTGTPRWKAVSNFNGSAPIGVMNGSTWTGATGSFGATGNEFFTTPGTYDWVAPVTSVEVRGWGSGAGGANGANGAGGGGGEFRKNTAVAVTIGNTYKVIVPAGGAPGAASSSSDAGDNGADFIFVGDAVSVIAKGGSKSSGTTGGAGGTGGTGPTGFNGGNGGSNPSNFRCGAGGGSSAGTAAAGGNGTNPTNDTTGNGQGGTPPAGAGGGGDGGDGHGSGNPADPGVRGVAPGGGGGGGGDNEFGGFNHEGGAGAPGQGNLIYTAPAGGAVVNVMRFILFVPKHAGNNGKILFRANTGSTKTSKVEVNFVSGSGGKLQLKVYDTTPTVTFDSGAQSWAVQGRTVMVSIELVTSGSNVNVAFRAIEPGSKTLIGSSTGTITTAATGNVSLITIAPNGDITKTAMGHVSLQYALIDLRKVSRALHGHHEEVGIHRFIRLLNEEAMGAEPGYNETNDHWGFETGTQSWVATNGALTNPTTSVSVPAFDFNFVLKATGASWPTDGTHSLLLTCNGAGSPSAHSPSGTSGQNILAGDRVAVAGHFYTPAAAANMYIGIQFYTAAGATVGAEQDCTDYSSLAGEIFTLTHHATAPATAAFFAVFWGNHGTLSNGTLLYADDITVHPKMGPHTRKRLHDFLHEMRELDQGILRESRKLWGLGYRTRLSLINQAAAVTLDYAAGALSDPAQPIQVPDPAKGRIRHVRRHPHKHFGRHHGHGLKAVFDEHNIKNDITVHRHKGSKIRVTLDSGAMSVQEPPAGTGRHRHHLKVAAHADEQLLALATHLLNLGTITDERYPEISVNLGRAGITGNVLAPLMSAIAGVECGDYVKLTNLPFWFPSSTAKQLVIGYHERINPFQWEITWNCTPESPWEITLTNLRRW